MSGDKTQLNLWYESCYALAISPRHKKEEQQMIRKLPSGEYRLYSQKINPKTGKRRNLGTFATKEQAVQHEREIHFFKSRGA